QGRLRPLRPRAPGQSDRAPLRQSRCLGSAGDSDRQGSATPASGAPVVQLAQSCPLQPAGGELRLDQFFEGASGEYSTSAAGTDWREVHLLGARLSNDNPLSRNESQRPWWLLHFLPCLRGCIFVMHFVGWRTYKGRKDTEGLLMHDHREIMRNLLLTAVFVATNVAVPL